MRVLFKNIFIQMKNINLKNVNFFLKKKKNRHSLVPSFDNCFSPMFRFIVKTSDIKTCTNQLNIWENVSEEIKRKMLSSEKNLLFTGSGN